MFLSSSYIQVETVKPALEVADVFRQYFAEYCQTYSVSYQQVNAPNAIMITYVGRLWRERPFIWLALLVVGLSTYGRGVM